MNILNETVQAVIFDVDGTIADSMSMWKDIDIEYLGRFHIPLPENLQKNIEGMSFYETALYFKENFPISDSIEKMMDDWTKMAADKYLYEIPLKKDVRKFLDFCKEKGFSLGIVTSNSRELLDCFLRQHHLEGYFDTIITGNDGLKGKPAPDMYLEAAKRLDVFPEKCLVFEDIIPGIRAAKNAGMVVCGVEDEYSKKEREEKRKEADYFIEGFYEFFRGE